MRLAMLPALAALLLGAPILGAPILGASIAAQPLAPDSVLAAPGPSLVFVDAGRAGPALAPLVRAPAGLSLAAPSIAAPSIAAQDDTLPKKRRAIEHSDLYYKRLTVHRWASYSMPPLFVGQYVLGEQLIRRRDRGEDAGATRDLHGAVAGGIAGLFAVNTVTGVWNLWDDRHEPVGRTRRVVHVLTMLVADAGFVATGMTAEDDDDDEEGGGGRGEISTHRSLAYGSMAIALASGAIMWFWKE